MRLLPGILIAGLVTSLSGVAMAQPKPKQLNLKPILDKLWVLQGDGGHHVIVVPPWERKAIRAMKLRGFSGLMLFGKNRKYYKQYVGSSGSSGTKKFSKHFVDNRVKGGGQLKYNQGVITLKCGKRITKLKMIEGDRRRRILHNSKFYERLWQRRSVALARDNMAKYYYVDRYNDAAGGQGFRLFYGPRGGLKRQRLRDVAQDSEGSVFATRKGSLVISRSSTTSARGYRRSTFQVKWVTKKGKQTKLKYIPPSYNRQLIYRDLGVYAGKRFGTPCDVY